MMRLLPWLGVDGKPCYLSGEASSFLGRLADSLEETQLGMSRDLLEAARTYTAEQVSSEVELRAIISDLCMALTDVLRVAESRGQRIPTPEEDVSEDEEARLSETVRSFTDRAIVRRSAP
jgi:hypothetical protein